MMTANGLQLRHELKFIIRTGLYADLSRRISRVLKPDPNGDGSGVYHIRSLYFDDIINSALHDKNAGLQHRAKYRIRLYNFSDRIIHFEKKIKHDSWIAKDSLNLTRASCEEILHGDWHTLAQWPDRLPDSGLAREINAVASAKLLRPKVIVDYVREAYIGPCDLRVTFDRSLSMAEPVMNLFRNDVPTRLVLPPDAMILEVKYNEWLPEMVAGMLDFTLGSQTAASKYVLCRSRQLNIQ